MPGVGRAISPTHRVDRSAKRAPRREANDILILESRKKVEAVGACAREVRYRARRARERSNLLSWPTAESYRRGILFPRGGDNDLLVGGIEVLARYLLRPMPFGNSRGTHRFVLTPVGLRVAKHRLNRPGCRRWPGDGSRGRAAQVRTRHEPLAARPIRFEHRDPAPQRGYAPGVPPQAGKPPLRRLVTAGAGPHDVTPRRTRRLRDRFPSVACAACSTRCSARTGRPASVDS